MQRELPQLSSTAMINNCYSGDTFLLGGINQLTTTDAAAWMNSDKGGLYDYDGARRRAAEQEYEKVQVKLRAKSLEPIKEEIMSRARLVQVFIADNDSKLPVEKRMLYKGEQLFTDLSDQDLFYDIEIKALITKHNEYRVTVVNEEKSTAAEKILLKPIKVSELSMVVAVLAEFK